MLLSFLRPERFEEKDLKERIHFESDCESDCGVGPCEVGPCGVGPCGVGPCEIGSCEIGSSGVGPCRSIIVNCSL